MSVRTCLSSLAAALVATALSAGQADASVVYQFTATSSFPLISTGESFTGSFTLTLPDFITQDLLTPGVPLQDCSFVSSAQGAGTCTDPWFLPDIMAGYDTIAFGVRDAAGVDTKLYYYFDDGAFSSLGFHDTQLQGRDQAGTLRVSNVPEPSSLGLLLVGIVGAAVVARRRNRGSALSAA